MRISYLELDSLTEDPESPTEGMLWYNATEKKQKRYLDSTIEEIADMADMGGSPNLDGGKANTNYGGIAPIDGGSA